MKMWSGHYLVEICYENGSIQRITIDKEGIPILISGYELNLYKKPLTKENVIILII